MSTYTEDNLVQRPTADYLEHELGWESVNAFHEVLGPDGTLGRGSRQEVVLTRYLREQLARLNPGFPDAAYEEAVRLVTAVTATQTTLAINRDKYDLIRDGVKVTYRDCAGELLTERLRLIDFDEPKNNHFLCVREFWVENALYTKRADIVGFVNGLPLLMMELKNVDKDLYVAYRDNLSDYKDTVPELFHYNAFVILGNGTEAKIGAFSSPYRYFHEWKRLEEAEPGIVDMVTLLKGVCDKANFIDLLENFIVFDESAGHLTKILAQNHQFIGVNRAFAAIVDRKNREGRLGVFWHTQGAGKSYSMVFLSRKVHRKLGRNFTFLVLTDRQDLDTQIYKTFAGCGVVDHDKDPCRAKDSDHLVELLSQHKAYVFSLIQKFHRKVEPEEAYNDRDDVIVMTDEAHRTQYGTLALNMRNALPNASYIGFTGTPLFHDDEITRRVFGDYISTYDFQRAREDGATVPLYYDARGEKLGVTTDDVNERIADKLEELEVDDIDTQRRLERALQREYHVITAEKRLNQIARDFVEHYSTAWETGKAMFVCIDKITCVRMYHLINKYWGERIERLKVELADAADEQEETYLRRKLAWMEETLAAVVVSQEQGEIEKFQKWGLDITPHRRLIAQGIELPESMRNKPEFKNMQRMAIDDAFKHEEHPFRIAIVCAMWLTGFDVPSLSTLYLDKPLKAHTLMQAMARANRVHEGKENGLIVDYCGILKNLRQALATFAGVGDGGRDRDEERDPTEHYDKLLDRLADAIQMTREFLVEQGTPLDLVLAEIGFARNAAIAKAKEAVNENDHTRKRFEVLARQVIRLFRACGNHEKVNEYRDERDAIEIIYRRLKSDEERADITEIMRELQQIVDDAIEPRPSGDSREERAIYDISRIDFERLKREFERIPGKRTAVQTLKNAVEKNLNRLLLQNPLRTDLQKRFEEIVDKYNSEKDRVTIETTFAALVDFVQELDEEQGRAMREGLDEETLALFDLLRKPELTAAETKHIKSVAVELLATLKAERLKVDNWREKEATRDAVRQTIYDFLYSDDTGLPVDTYTEEEVKSTTEAVFGHVFRVYPTLPSPFYDEPGVGVA